MGNPRLDKRVPRVTLCMADREIMPKGNALMSGRNAIRFAALVIGLPVVIAMQCSAAAAELKTPSCDALKQWLPTIDRNARWTPVDGSRAWLPDVFREDTFAALFGKPVQEWTRAEANGISRHLFDCGTAAGEAGSSADQTLFYGARGWFKSNLVGVTIALQRAAQEAEREQQKAERARQKAEQQQKQAERARQRAVEEERIRSARSAQRTEAEAQHKTRRAQPSQGAAEVASDPSKRGENPYEAKRLVQAVDALLNQPDSPRLVAGMVAILETDTGDSRAIQAVNLRYGPYAGDVLAWANRLGVASSDPRIAPPLQARIAAVRKDIVADYDEKLTGIVGKPGAVNFLNRWEAELKGSAGEALAEGQRQNLLARIDATRTEGLDALLAGYKQRTDTLARRNTPDRALSEISGMMSNARKAGLSSSQFQELDQYASNREAELARAYLEERTALLNAVDETYEGLLRLMVEIDDTLQVKMRGGALPGIQSYRETAGARLDAVAKAALPEYREALDAVAADDGAAQELQMIAFAFFPPFELASGPVRQAYEAALRERFEEIKAEADN